MIEFKTLTFASDLHMCAGRRVALLFIARTAMIERECLPLCSCCW